MTHRLKSEVFMANMRKEGKKMLGGWVPEELDNKLKALAKSDGVAKSVLVETILTKYAEKYGYKPKK